MATPHRMETHLFVTVILFCQVSFIHLQSCIDRVPVLTSRLDPTPFLGVTTISPQLIECERERVGIVCVSPNPLNDDVTGSLHPDFPSDAIKFVAWTVSSQNYIVFVPTVKPLAVSAIDIYFYHNPGQGIGLPNFELHGLSSDVADSPSPTDPELNFEIINNSELSQEDQQLRRIILVITTPSPFTAYSIRWSFDNLINISWFVLSEILLCNDPPMNPTSSISFSHPLTDRTFITPQTGLLRNGSLTLNCTVAIAGHFMWRWREGNTITLSGDNPGTTILTDDGTRTSVLIVPIPSITTVYHCDVSFVSVVTYYTKSFEVSILSVEGNSDASGNSGEMITLECQFRGYVNGLVERMWTRGENALAVSDKYSMQYMEEGRSLENTLNYTIANFYLTIRNLNSFDKGNYTCVIENNNNIETHTIILSISTSDTVPSATNTAGGLPVDENTTTEGGVIGSAKDYQAVIIAIVVVLIVVLIPVVAAIFFLFFVIIKRNHKIKSHHEENRHSSPLNELKNHNNHTECGEPIIESGASTDDLYSSINKERPPSLPSRHYDDTPRFHDFDPTTNVYTEVRGCTMTNLTAPKLAKLHNLASLGISNQIQNSIYETTMNSTIENDNKQFLVKSQLTASDESGVFILPSSIKEKKEPKRISDDGETIYSVILTPDMFHKSNSSPREELSPYGPIYAQPTKFMKNSNEVKKVTSANYREVGHLGVGQFGDVALAETVQLSKSDIGICSDTNRDISIKVAIKKLQSNASVSVRENFEKEITFMSSLKDDNIIRILAVGGGQDPFIMMEYMENGDLHQLLNDYSAISVGADSTRASGHPIHISLLLKAVIQISSGMKYLALRNCIHRDLATRNCLVSDNFVVKIGDFGMSRNLYEQSYYKVKGRAMMPIRWMATESFYGRFSEKTDVWSFGVVLWEIFTLCRLQPYSNMDDQDFIKDAVKGKDRQLLERPDDCPHQVYDVMLKCWVHDGQHRPTFKDINKVLTVIGRDYSLS